MNKPEQIIELEKLLGFELRETKNLDKIMRWETSKIYCLNENRQVVGLSLLDCEVSEVSFLKNLKSLKSLNLRYNFIENISFLNECKSLEKLNLGANRIGDLGKDFIESLPNLKELYLYGNPIKNIPEELFGVDWNCLEFLKDYFQSIENPEDRQELNEAKLIFVGRGMVGKTELADAISEENYIFNPDRKSTEGIRIKTWQPSIEKQNKKIDFNVNIWDFAGQEINYGTHQFFLTKSSLYVLVWRWRVDDPANRFSLEYWLNIIKLLSDSSPVLVVQNWIDEDGIKRVPEYQWKELFPNIVGFYHTSCLDGRGIEELRAEIRQQIIKLPHTSEVWNKHRVAIRQSLEQNPENYISYSDYLRLCEKHQIDKTAAKFLSEQLHKIGVILHFRNDIRFEDTIILKPEWATQAAYKLIDEKLNPDGHFKVGDLKNYWKEEIYEGKYQYLLNLMLRFYLIFNISRTDEYIVPDLLAENPPENLPTLPKEKPLIFEYHYSFMPKSILTHFICLNASYIQGNSLWKNGVFLQQNGSKARVTGSELLNYIRIEVSGTHSDEFLSILRGFIHTVHKDILDEEPVFTEVIPCPCEKCEKQDEYFDRYFFGYQLLKDLKLEGEITVRCGKNAKAKFNIDRLLTGIEPLKNKEDLIFETVKEIKETQKEHLTISKDTNQSIKQFIADFATFKAQNNEDLEEKINLLQQLIDKQKPQNLNYYAQKAQIEFPKFNSLQNDSQTFMAMGFYFLEILPNSGDFSPVALQFCRVLELEIKTVLMDFKNLGLSILMNDSGLGTNQQAYNWLKDLMNNKEITLPQMKAIFENIPNLFATQLFQALDSFVNSKPLYANLTNFVLIVTEITDKNGKDYRNKSAHTHPISKAEAEDCKNLVLQALDLWK
jgi:internalin A